MRHGHGPAREWHVGEIVMTCVEPASDGDASVSEAGEHVTIRGFARLDPAERTWCVALAHAWMTGSIDAGLEALARGAVALGASADVIAADPGMPEAVRAFVASCLDAGLPHAGGPSR